MAKSRTERRIESIRSFLRNYLNVNVEMSEEGTKAHQERFIEDLEQELKGLPSKYQIGDKVSVVLFEAGTIKNCTVTKVHFDEEKVFYSLVVLIDEANGYYTRLPNIDSAFISDN